MVLQYHSQILVIFDNVVPLGNVETWVDNAYRSNANKLSRTVKNLTIKCNEQAFYGTSGQKWELFRGGEDKGRTPGRIDGGTVQPGPGTPVRWLNKGGKREKWGEITEQYFIFHIRKRAKSRKPRKGMGTRRARYGRGRSGHPLHPLQQLGTKKFRLIWLGRIRKKLNTLTYSRL